MDPARGATSTAGFGNHARLATVARILGVQSSVAKHRGQPHSLMVPHRVVALERVTWLHVLYIMIYSR